MGVRSFLWDEQRPDRLASRSRAVKCLPQSGSQTADARFWLRPAGAYVITETSGKSLEQGAGLVMGLLEL